MVYNGFYVHNYQPLIDFNSINISIVDGGSSLCFVYMLHIYIYIYKYISYIYIYIVSYTVSENGVCRMSKISISIGNLMINQWILGYVVILYFQTDHYMCLVYSTTNLACKSLVPIQTFRLFASWINSKPCGCDTNNAATVSPQRDGGRRPEDDCHVFHGGISWLIMAVSWDNNGIIVCQYGMNMGNYGVASNHHAHLLHVWNSFTTRTGSFLGFPAGFSIVQPCFPMRQRPTLG